MFRRWSIVNYVMMCECVALHSRLVWTCWRALIDCSTVLTRWLSLTTFCLSLPAFRQRTSKSSCQ